MCCKAEQRSYNIGEFVDDHKAQAVMPNGEFKEISLKEYQDAGKWIVLYFYPADFTFVCPTEIRALSEMQEKFEKLNAQVIGVSTDKVFSHKAWIENGLGKINHPLMEDPTGELSRKFGVYSEEKGLAWRGLFILCNHGQIHGMTINFEEAGRSATETLRQLAACQNSHAGKLVPCDWQPGDEFLTKG